MIAFGEFSKLKKGDQIQSMQMSKEIYEIQGPPFLHSTKGENRRVIYGRCLTDERQAPLHFTLEQMAFFNLVKGEDKV